MSKKTMTLNLTDPEMAVLEELSQKKGLTKTALLRQALRLYQSIEMRTENGEKIYFENQSKTEKTELVVI
ncbi:MAG TPA: ribbon-helix-helix protein, CopG family [Gammaproteobacteria bacterium]